MNASYPLTPLQEGMFAGSFPAGKPWLYLEQIVVHLDDERLDRTQLEAAWNTVLVRHPSLRNQISQKGIEAPAQSASEAAEVSVAVLDWESKPAAEIETGLTAFLADDRAQGIDPGVAPAFRLTLIHTGAASSKLIWTFPHSLLDGRSFTAIMDEAMRIYDALSAGEAVSQEPAPDVFRLHCETLAQMSHADGIAHFRETLAGWEGSEGLTDTAVAPVRKSYIDQYLTQDQTKALDALARQTGTTMGTLVMAAWGLVTARASGQTENVFGVTLNGRHLVDGSAGAPGCFIVTVPMRVRLTPDLTVEGLLKRLRADQIALRPFEQTPITDIKAQTDVPFEKPLFDTAVMFETATLEQQFHALGGKWPARRVDLLEEGDVPVTLAVYQGDAMKVTVEYDPAQAPIGPDLAAYVFRLLEELAGAAPDTPLSQLSMLSGDVLAQIKALAGPQPTLPETLCCATRFEQIAQARPDAVALEQDGAEPLSYGGLDQAANDLAHQLIAAGVKPGDRVGIQARRSPRFVIAQIAAWKAGAAFVPMDPTYPEETLRILAEDSGAVLVLTDEGVADLGVKTLPLADIGATTAPPDRSEMDPDRLAYVIFTSGSTGRPKGVMVRHSALSAHVDAAATLYEIAPADRALQFASLSFDVSLEEIVPTLLTGATLVLRSDEMAESATYFLERVEALGLTLLNLPTGFWVALTDVLETMKSGLPACVRMVVVGGERVPLAVLRRFRACVPDLPWVNGYGPTETTITCTAHRLRDGDLDGASVPIGSPLGHAQAWILSADGALAPLGTPGELFISGPAVTDGYIGAPERTAQSFRVAGFDPDVGRIYATGDRCLWDGELLYYIGRTDRQIKLRGFRIDPGQVESVFEAMDDVGRAHVDVWPPKGGAQRLVAWYSPSDPEDAAPLEDVSARANAALPPHMHPELIAVDDWPQTPGGKIDTKALPAPETAGGEASGGAAPDTPLTQEIADMFGEMLGQEDVAADASFFMLGGNSLSLMRLLAQVEQKFGTRIKPAALYTDPSPRGVVKALTEQDPDPLIVLPIQPGGDLPPLYGVHVLGDNGSFFRPLAAELGKDQPVFGLTVGLLTEDTPTQVEDIARFYLHQIERHQPEGPLSLIAVSAGSYVTLELAQQLLAAGREVSALILLDAEGPGGRQRVGKLGRVLAHLRNLARGGVPYLKHQLAERREAKAHTEAMARLGQDTSEAGGAGVQDVTDFIAANTLAIEQYQPQPYARRLTIFRAADDLFDSAEAKRDGLGWGCIAQAGFDLTDVPGDHLGLLEPPNVKTLAQHVKQRLEAEHHK